MFPATSQNFMKVRKDTTLSSFAGAISSSTDVFATKK